MSSVYRELDVAVARLYADAPKTIVIPRGALVFLVGLAGSGKSTFALNNFPLECIVSGDLLRAEISDNVRNQVVSDEAFAFVGTILKERLSRGRTTVIDAKNLESMSRKSFLRIARASGSPIVAIFLDIPAEVCIARDARRIRQVGAKAILPDEIRRERALYALAAEGDSAIYRIDVGTASSVCVILEDCDAYKHLPYQFDSEMVRKLYMGNVEVAVHVREQVIGHYVVVSEGGILVLEHDTPSSGMFLRRNFQPYQVLDVRVVAGRLGAEVTDDVVVEFVCRMLSCRTRLNLVTVLSVPKEYARTADILKEMLLLQKKREHIIAVTHLREGEGIGAYLTSALVRIDRRGMDDEPLAIIGDVQGCLTALRSVVQNIHKENEYRLRDGKPKRRIVFVGDMADRGTYDAESILYIIDLLRSCEALLVRGNHDENLARGLRGGDPGSHETARTIAELAEITTQSEREEIATIIESMPCIATWKHVVVAHATLAHIPRAEEKLSQRELHDITHGISTGRYVALRREIWNLPLSCAKDPDVLFVSGHTHEVAPVIDNIAVAAVLDAGVEKRGELFWMKWPEMEVCKGVEPEIAQNYKILRGNKLPPCGKRLRQFVDYVAINGYVSIKKGKGDQDGLLIVSYTNITEATDAWGQYPILRNFRGLVIDEFGNIVARPFSKTHKAGVEVPLKELNRPALHVSEKVNGTLVILYFWNGEWRLSTKFSFSNQYTEAAQELLPDKRGMSKLDVRKTYLFELILPEDPHIVDYGKMESLVLLNAINTVSGRYATWKFVEKTARDLGVRMAFDKTPLWPRGTSVAEIYRSAQEPGLFQNVEGFMALYVDDRGCKQTVKIKARDYDDRKFMRDMKWSKLLEAFDFEVLDVPLAKRLELLYYNVSNPSVRWMLETRIFWIRDTYERLVRDAGELVADALAAARECLAANSANDEAALREALRVALPLVAAKIKGKYGLVTRENLNPHMGFVRSALSKKESQEQAIHRFAVKVIESVTVRETERRGKCAFWVVPNT